MYSTIPIHWNIKTAQASPCRSRVGPALYVFSLLSYAQREERPREEMPREYWYFSVGGPLCTEQAASTVYSVLWSNAVQNILCWLACSVHNGPPSPKFQILPSQLRQTADRAAGLTIKDLWVCPPPSYPQPLPLSYMVLNITRTLFVKYWWLSPLQ